MTYVDGFIVAVPTAKKEAYRQHAAEAEPIFKEFGAARMVEGWGEDVPDGKVTDYRRAVQATPEETIVFSWFEYPDRETRNAANQKMMSDPRMEKAGRDMPFDGKRMVYGGFEVIHDEGDRGPMAIVNGMVVAAPADSKEEYRQFAAATGAIFLEHGASRVLDAWEDDVPDGKITDFRRAVKVADGEKVAFGWVEWPSREAHDKGWEKVMSDPRMQELKMPFDGQRMIYGSFLPIVDK
jgi:uncharacterized protein YbaA (DUF1428 family)